jgi:hypothetical protein
VDDGIYPAATATRGEYDLQLLHNGAQVLPITWIDYRGAALLENASSNDAQRLVQDLKEADAILAFFDAVALTNLRSRRNREVGRLVAVLTKAIADLDQIMPVGLILTKFDQLDDNADDAIEPLQGLIDAISQSQTIHGALVPTACGRDQLINVAVPVLFVLHLGILGRLHRLKSSVGVHMERGRRLQSNAGVIDWLSSKWNGLPTNGQLASREFTAASSEIALHNQLVVPADALAPHLKDTIRF